MTRQQVDDWAQTAEEELIVADGFDDAILGIGQQGTRTFVVYDRATCLEILQTRDGLTEEDAEEFLVFNVIGAYVGEATPCFLVREW